MIMAKHKTDSLKEIKAIEVAALSQSEKVDK